MKSKLKLHPKATVFSIPDYADGPDGRIIAVCILKSPLHPAEDFDRMTRQGFKLNLVTGIYERE